jgi:hypothetical protein
MAGSPSQMKEIQPYQCTTYVAFGSEHPLETQALMHRTPHYELGHITHPAL